MPAPIVYRDYQPHDPIGQITQLLHESYAPLLALGVRYPASYQEDWVTEQRLTSGMPMVAELDGEIVGTITLYLPNPESPCAWYNRREVCRFGQFAVRPDMQRRGIGSELVRLVERRALKHSAQELALDTAELAAETRQWYDHRGFRFIQFVCWPNVDYRSVVLSKPLPKKIAKHASKAPK